MRFYSIPESLFKDKRLSMSEKYLWVVLQSYAFSEESRIFPKLESLAIECNCSKKTIQNMLEKLKFYKYVEVHRGHRKNSNVQSSNEYILNPDPENLDFKAIQECKEALREIKQAKKDDRGGRCHETA